MAVSIDTVYQRVLAAANKEQRGYITPLEFNLLANQAQLAIFEQYFYDLDQFKRGQSEETSLSDMTELIKNKIAPFTTVGGVSAARIFPGNYRIGKIFFNGYTVTKVTHNEFNNFLNSTFHRSGLEKNPVYRESVNSGEDIEVIGLDTSVVPPVIGILSSGVTCEVISKPGKVEWGYDVIAEQALYNPSNSTQDFYLHESEETTLVLKILELSGLILQDVGVIQYADNEGTKKTQQEKI